MNKVTIKGIENAKLKDGAKLLIKQKPNKKLFGVWCFYLRAYNYGMRGDTSKRLRKYIRQNIGEQPVVLDSNKLEQTATQLSSYLFNNGFYNAKVTYNVTSKKTKKASIVFTVTKGSCYSIKQVIYGIDDRLLNEEIMKDTAASKIKVGDYFNSEKIAEERERITKKLRNLGYYYFNKEYIVFKIDSSFEGSFVQIDIQIRNPSFFLRHQRYKINQVYVNVVNPYIADTSGQVALWDTLQPTWVNLNGYKISKGVLLKRIFVLPQQTFNQTDIDNSYNRLNDLQLFRQSSIGFEKDTAEGILNCYINLFPAKRQEYLFEPQIITSDQNNAVEQNNQRNYGLANALTYRNRNFFGNAETFDLRYRISVEGQVRNNDSLRFLSNIEHNVTATLGLPNIYLLRFLQPKYDLRNTRSALVGNFIYESNIDFNRRVLSLGYNELFNRVLNSLNISLLEVSFNKTNAKRNFLSLVNSADSIFIANLFTTNLIVNSRITWVYNDKPISRKGSYFFSRSMIEFAGNSLYGLFRLSKSPLPADGIYKIDNVNFEQFIKIDQDFRYTHVLNELNTVAYRLHIGAGLPFGNSKVMPFVRRYFIGGANSLRGWRPRTLGPGSFSNSGSGLRADRSGEMILEAQAEYRFSIIRGVLQGALFADAGNIWYTSPISGRTGSDFKLEKFIPEMAVSSGLGLRFDFSFFVVRFDFGLPLRNPELTYNQRWLLNDYANGKKNILSSTILNLGLGYPF